MAKQKLPPEFIQKCKSITAKRAKTVIDHVLKHGHITSQELKDTYGYNHPPRAIRDVKEHGIPMESFRVEGHDGRKIAAYRFGDPAKARVGQQAGRTVLGKELKKILIAANGARCAIYQEVFPESELQIDHRIPFEVLGDDRAVQQKPDDYMLLCGSANRAKSWSCEHCINWRELKRPDVCRSCYWAYPDTFVHVAMRQVRRTDIMWFEDEVEHFEKLRNKTRELQKNIPSYVKEIIREKLGLK